MTLHLVRCAVDSRALLAFAREHGLHHRHVDDDGYVLHGALTALFGPRVLSPFVAEEALDPPTGDRRGAPATRFVLGYSEVPLAALESASPDPHRHIVRWAQSASKPMPELTEDRLVGFVARVTPTRRSRAPRPGHEGGGRGHARDVDAFLAAISRNPDARLDRAEVYREWMAEQLAAARHDRASAAELVDFSLRRFERARLLRRQQDAARTRHVVERPVVVVSGALRVREPTAFRALLRRGVGRHRAFGFGMLLLRPA